MTDTGTTVTARFGTLCGGTVVITAQGRDHAWRCDCGANTGPASPQDARESANTHAGACRALPPDAR
jgi:hypothetical protein